MGQAFDNYGGLRAAALQVMASAQHTLDIFDVSGLDLGLGQQDVVEKLELFLHVPTARLRIVVHDTAHIERECPRLTQMLRYHGHQISIHRTLPEAEQAHDSLVIADGILLLRRYHTDFPRGQLQSAAEEQIAPWLQRFEAVWEASEPAVSFTTLGL